MDPESLKKIIAFRRNLHQYPQVSLKQFQTRQKIIDILLSFGVPQHSFHKSYPNIPTALIVDLKGQAQPQGTQYCVAFRADTDALNMVEQNQHLQYRSKNHGAAHMCGHDGHVACLVGFVSLFLSELKKIPSNKTIRLLFQPSEEGPISGAKLMIKQGCLQGVHQVYGFHNLPIGTFGHLWCKEGPVMSESTVLKITITGTGGHGSEPDLCKVAIWKAVDFYHKFQQFLNNLKKQKADKQFVCTLPVFQAGQRHNVISQSVRIEGTLRSFDQEIKQIVTDKIKQLLKQIENDGFSVKYDASDSVITSNTKNQSDNILRVAKQVLGDDRVGRGILPLKASEDFGYYTKQKPGAFFFFCTKTKEDDAICHDSRFDFNDNIIEIASNFWYRLALDRLSSQ